MNSIKSEKNQVTTLNLNVSTLPQFIEAVKKIVDEESNKEYDFYFRGHSDSRYLLIPQLLRNGSFAKDKEEHARQSIVTNEHIAFRNVVAQQSSEFAQCKSAIEYLVKMQHYGLKTRLLDITSNALIALYFACANHLGDANGKEGEVIIFKFPKGIIKHYDSDTISAVANIAKCDDKTFLFPLCGDIDSRGTFVQGLGYDCKSQTYKKYTTLYLISQINQLSKDKKHLFDNTTQTSLNKVFSKLREMYNGDPTVINELKNCETASSQASKTKLSKQLQSLASCLLEISKQGYSTIGTVRKQLFSIMKGTIKTHNAVTTECREWFNRNLGFLHHQIKAEKPYYTERIDPYDLGRIWVVKSKLDNKRIINQSGAFLIFGLGLDEVDLTKGVPQLSYTKTISPLIPDEWIAGRIKIGFDGITEESVNGISEQDISDELTTSEKSSVTTTKDIKEKIISDLAMLGIRQSFIFPELENVANEINRTLLK